MMTLRRTTICVVIRPSERGVDLQEDRTSWDAASDAMGRGVD